jgi:DNA polymerase-3 subunit gamma/tau
MTLPLPERYRPKRLEDVIGQKTIIKAITAALSRRAIPKSWLLTGPSGTGKTTLAEILGNHFAGGKAGPANIIYVNAAVDTGAEETRNTVNKAHYKALGESTVKTHIIDECQNLSSKAWDSLLIATERPPAHVFWVLCSTNPAKIPETIKTRCLKYTLKPVDEAEIFDLLTKVSTKEKLNALPEVLEVIAEGCNGSPREALSNLEKVAHSKTANEARELLRSALQMKGPVDLARALIGNSTGRLPQWTEVTKLINLIENVDAETIRIVMINYIAGALIKAKSDNEARRMLAILECFSTPYIQSDKLAPLLMSVGLALGLDQ